MKTADAITLRLSALGSRQTSKRCRCQPMKHRKCKSLKPSSSPGRRQGSEGRVGPRFTHSASATVRCAPVLLCGASVPVCGRLVPGARHRISFVGCRAFFRAIHNYSLLHAVAAGSRRWQPGRFQTPAKPRPAARPSGPRQSARKAPAQTPPHHSREPPDCLPRDPPGAEPAQPPRIPAVPPGRRNRWPSPPRPPTPPMPP